MAVAAGREAARGGASCALRRVPRARPARAAARGSGGGGGGGGGGVGDAAKLLSSFVSGVKDNLAMLQSKLEPIEEGATLDEAVATGIRLHNVERDRSVALNVFTATYERVIDVERQTGPTEETNAAAVQCLWGAMCCYASFGDLEMAKQSLRDGLERGLVFEKAFDGGESGVCARLMCAAQMRLNLQRFAAGNDVSFGTFQRREFEERRKAGKEQRNLKTGKDAFN